MRSGIDPDIGQCRQGAFVSANSIEQPRRSRWPGARQPMECSSRAPARVSVKRSTAISNKSIATIATMGSDIEFAAGWLRRCEPMRPARDHLFLPGPARGRVANFIDRDGAAERASHCVLNQSRTCRSKSVNVSRHRPPFIVAPIRAVDISAPQKPLAVDPQNLRHWSCAGRQVLTG